ncbi:MAG: transcription elongation factor GreA [Candidatus Yonathbacteria bacterium]|nr:transcription elongation factor GreA [Candidatus Yonathbacteria bacterium]NTW48062.1 transcription elongation factor GreA [Candidatus Yonathbacteria bacterium]
MLLSKEKLEELKNELAHLKTTRRKEIADELEYAKSLGDLSENAEYHEARDNQAKIEKRIVELEAIVKDAKVMTHVKSDVIRVGSHIVVKKKKEGTIREMTLVESEEADSAAGKFSVASPLGNALLGHKKGDEVSYESPAGTMTYVIEQVA